MQETLVQFLGWEDPLEKGYGGGNGNPLQYSCLENPMDRGGWQATVHGVMKSQTWLQWLSMHANIIDTVEAPCVTFPPNHSSLLRERHYSGSVIILVHIWKKVKMKSLSRVRLCDPMDCSLPGFSVHGIFQARVLQRVAISFSCGSSWPRDQTQVSRIVGRRLPSEPPGRIYSIVCIFYLFRILVPWRGLKSRSP